MLTAKENLRQTIVAGGSPDRFVNCYEGLQLLGNPFNARNNMPTYKGPEVVNAWGVANSWPEGTPGGFPVHTQEKILIKDIEHWQDYLQVPPLDFSQTEWDAFQPMWDNADDDLAFKAAFIAPGLFEQTHNFMSMVPALVAYMENPDEMHDLIAVLTEWELKLAEGICAHYHPNAVFHHDDWGSQTSTFLSPDMFAEFFVEPYQQIYGYYHDHGVEFIFHHSDSFGATLVPYMIEMGIDVWQGCMESNDVPALVEKYKGKISFMGNIDNMDVDFEGWSESDCDRAVARALGDVYSKSGLGSYIPSINQGGPGSVYQGVYMGLAESIDEWNAKTFGFSIDELNAARVSMEPLQKSVLS